MKTPSLIEVCSAEDGRARARHLSRVRECIARGVDPASVPWSRLPWERETLRAIGLERGVHLGSAQKKRAWTPLAFGASLWLWLRGDQYNPTTGTWADLGPGGRHVSQATPANRPVLAMLAGLPALDLDGGDFLDSADLDAAPLAQAFTIFIVAKDDVGGAGSRTLIDTSAALSSNRVTIFQPANVVGFASAGFTTGSAMGTSPRILEFVFNGAGSKFRLDGGSEATGNVGANSWGQIRIGTNASAGAGTFWDGVVGEVFAVSGEMSAADRTIARRYLGARWGITVP